MSYPLSATKLQTYARCPQAYYFRYERGLKAAGVFASAALGTALHKALDRFYREWHYQTPIPPYGWLMQCWSVQTACLTDRQQAEGQQMLQHYYEREVVSAGVMHRPLATEGRVQGSLLAGGIEFTLSGRYDRLDFTETGGLALIDYKSAKAPKLAAPDEIDLQLGLYSLALEQRYGRSLERMSLLYLRTGDRVTYEVTAAHKQRVEAVISDIALRLLAEAAWQPQCAQHCEQCEYAKYCSAMQPQPEVLPDVGKPKKLQLSLCL